MSRSGTDVTELVAALCRGEMDLGSVLEAMSARGALPEAEYSAGVVTLQRFRAELDEDTLRELRLRMDALRAGDDDATVVSPVAARVPPSPAPPSPPPSPAEGDVTRVEPRAPQPRPREPGPGTTAGTRASTSGSMASAEWARIAEAEAGEVAGVGMLLKGRFLLERELGRGGMGVVYLARDDRKVEAQDRDPYLAVKVLNDEFRRHPDSLVALQRESRRSQKLAHDNIVRVYDFDKAGTIVFMTMEYIDGTDLRGLIRERAFSGMPLARARPLIEGMGRALARAHAAGIVHSDFKPGNVMVTADGTAKVFDFGIARAGKHGGASGEVTVFDAATLGALTPAYASLEMIEGGEPSPADDVYALGCVCYELLTGRHPFDKASAEVALREGRTPPRVKGLTRRQARALRRSVALRASERLSSVEALLEGLREVPARERLLPLAGYGIALVLVAGGAGWGVHHWLPQRQLAAVVAGFSSEGGDGFADEAAAMAALSALSPEDRDALVLRENRRIESFLLRRLDALWNPAQGRYDYVQAQGVFELRNRLRLFSPTLDERAQRMADEKHDVLNALDTRLTAQIESGAIFDVAGDADAADTLRNIRAMDPDSLLLRHPGLELAFAEAVAEATGDGRLDLATARLDEARAVFPESLRLELAGAGLEAALAEEASRRRPSDAAPRDAAAARTLLAARIAQPSTDPAWQADVAAALELLRADGLNPGDQALVEALARAIAHQAAGASEPRQLARASSLVAFGLAQAPDSSALLAEQARLDELEQALEARLASEAGQPFYRIDPLKINVSAVTPLMSFAFAQRHGILAVDVSEREVTIASAQPFVRKWEADLVHVLKRDIRRVVASPADIQRYSVEFYRLARSVHGANASDQKASSVGNFEQLLNLGNMGQEPDANDAHVVNIVDWLLQYAYEQRASDIHLEPRRDVGRVRFRIDGVLHKVFEMPPPVMTAVVSRIKVLGRMDLAERRRPQDGRIKTRSPGGREVEMRLSTMPTAFGEKCVMRIFDPDTAFKSIEQLGFDPDEADTWHELTNRPHGIVLVTGPTGSGKTTTLYSTLKRLATSDVNVCTVEDPIEMIATELNQMQVHHAIDLTFAQGVRTLLRQDPDIIMIGEIRDLDTAQMAVQASLTGHLVLSTLHTNDAPSAVTRLLDLGLPHYLIASTLTGVLAQRLVRTLCPHCKRPQTVEPGGWEALLGPDAATPEGETMGPVGCLECRKTGYMGRVGLYELMPITPALRKLVRPEMELAEFSRAARADGLRTLRLAGAAKVAQGLTTIEEVITVLPPRE